MRRCVFSKVQRRMHALIGKTPYTLELGLQAAVSLASSLCVYVVSMAYGIFMPFFPDLVPSVILGLLPPPASPPLQKIVSPKCDNEIHSPLVAPFVWNCCSWSEIPNISATVTVFPMGQGRNDSARVGLCGDI